MIQYIEKYKRNIATDMRKRGFSYSDIENRLHIPKSTLAYWLKGMKLDDALAEKLKERQLKALLVSAKKRSSRVLHAIEEIKNSSAKNIGRISQRELWLIGIVLYWRERLARENENDLKRGVRFSSSDPYLIKLFLKWLKDIGKIEDNEITFDIFISNDQRSTIEKVIDHWSKVTDFPRNAFNHVYYQKSIQVSGSQKSAVPKKKRNITRKSSCGFLRIRVKASSLLVRQIVGWIQGIQGEL